MSATCDYCGEKLDRKVFCSPSHKVLYHKRGALPKEEEKQPEWAPVDLSKKKQAHGGFNK
jgi:hypothetical protein